MKSKTRFIPLVIIGAIILSLMAVMPVFSQDAGMVLIIEAPLDADRNVDLKTLDPDATDAEDALEWARQGDRGAGTESYIVIEVADDDANQADDFEYDWPVPNGAVGMQFINVPEENRPLAGANVLSAGLTVNVASSTASTAASTTIITVVSQEDGAIQINLGIVAETGLTGSDNFIRINFQGATVDQVPVAVESNTDDLVLTLSETGRSTGVFRGSVRLVPDTLERGDDHDPSENIHAPIFDEAGATTTLSATTTLIVAANNDEVTVSYEDPEDEDDQDEYSVSIESTSPTIANHAPSHGSIDDGGRPDLTADITDNDSGMGDEDDAEGRVTLVVAKAQNDSVTNIDDFTAPSLNDIDGGVSAEESVDSGFGQTNGRDTTFYWWYIGEDIAGNLGVSDQDPDSPTQCDPYEFARALDKDQLKDRLNDDAQLIDAELVPLEDDDGEPINRAGDGSEYAGCQGFSYTVDENDPDLESARTGAFWDTDIDDDDKTNMDPNDANPSSILLVFSEKLDPDSIDPDDFTVNGDSPFDAEVFSGNQKHVFLGVPALDPDETPDVRVVDDVADLAGRNLRRSAEIESKDGIAPTLEVAITGAVDGGDQPATDDEITIQVTVNERVSQPKYVIWRVTDPATSTIESDGSGGYETIGSGVIPFDATRTYEVTVSLDNETSGLYSVLVTAGDAGNSQSTAKAGADHAAADADPFEDVDGALTFELDLDVVDGGDLILDPNSAEGDDDRNTFSTDDPEAFISIDLSAEGAEYISDDDDADTYNAVTIIEAKLGDEDITDGLVGNDAGNVYLYKASALALGEHDLTVTASDAVGNERDFEGTVTIEERDPFSVKLSPGWNLVSIPSNPADTSLNSVIPADHPVSTVLTYDPTVPGGWLTALRGADGTLSGTLMEITSGRAYWMLTDSFEAISVDIPKPRPGSADFLPTVNLVRGWNLVPILDVDGDFELENYATDDGYFGSIADDSLTVYGYDTVSNTWSLVGGDEVEIGKGYWVFTDTAATLVPR